MKKIKIGIVEDELIIAENIRYTLTDLGYDVTEAAINYSEAIEMIETENPDLVLLDIVLSGHKDGIDLARKVKEEYDIPFIFLTSNADKGTIDRAKELNPPSYLVKPFNRNDLYAAIEIAVFNHMEREKPELQAAGKFSDAVFVKQNSLYYKILLEDIYYLNSDHVYVDIYTVDTKFTDRKSLSDYEQILPSERFLRIHRSYIVNKQHIEAIGANSVRVKGVELPVGRSFKEKLMKLTGNS